jgi:hypothetical protein
MIATAYYMDVACVEDVWYSFYHEKISVFWGQHCFAAV